MEHKNLEYQQASKAQQEWFQKEALQRQQRLQKDFHAHYQGVSNASTFLGCFVGSSDRAGECNKVSSQLTMQHSQELSNMKAELGLTRIGRVFFIDAFFQIESKIAKLTEELDQKVQNERFHEEQHQVVKSQLQECEREKEEFLHSVTSPQSQTVEHAFFLLSD